MEEGSQKEGCRFAGYCSPVNPRVPSRPFPYDVRFWVRNLCLTGKIRTPALGPKHSLVSDTFAWQNRGLLLLSTAFVSTRPSSLLFGKVHSYATRFTSWNREILHHPDLRPFGQAHFGSKARISSLTANPPFASDPLNFAGSLLRSGT